MLTYMLSDDFVIYQNNDFKIKTITSMIILHIIRYESILYTNVMLIV